MGKKWNITVGQSGGSTSVTNFSLARVYKTVKERGFRKVYGMLHGIERLSDEMYVDLSIWIHSDMDTELLKRAPSVFLGSCRYKLPDIHENPAFYGEILAILNKLGIGVFIYIGDNDFAGTIRKLPDYTIVKGHDQKLLGVLKAIDNDLILTDHTPGFGGATKYVATPIREVVRDVMGLSYRRKTITIMEYMGRNVGWPIGSTTLAKVEDYYGPDSIYLPEISFDIEKSLERCKELIQKKPSAVIAVFEGTRVPDGRYVCWLLRGSDHMDAFGHKQLAGIADYLAGLPAGELGCKTGSVELSILQRSASHMVSRVDINEALVVGDAAVKVTDGGDTGKMMVVDRASDDPYMNVIDIYDVCKIVNSEKTVPKSWVNKDGGYVTRELVSYVEPLIQGDYQPFMVDGLPQHLVLKR